MERSLVIIEREIIKLPASKKLYVEDVVIDSDVAIFDTSKSPITYRGPYNTPDPQEDAMMATRWQIFSFHHQFIDGEQRDIAACARCFAKLVLQGKDVSNVA